MRCSGLSLSPIQIAGGGIGSGSGSGSESRFCYLPTTKSTKSSPLPPPLLIKWSLRASASASMNDGLVTEEGSSASLSFYELLGIPESGSLFDIKQAYKQLARKYHPDVSPPGRVEEYTKRFIRVQEAYETLSDPTTRALYDTHMAKGLHFAFSATRRRHHHQGMEEKGDWKNRWQAQLSELKKRSMSKDARGDLSWGARMRRRRDEMK
ncbi:chaperone protein dnaJ 20, chloroplastic-like [Quercus robur]|uniref:chaperone protein dnaJ 20, chloroplastic-like n=1 Tax=Quercus robur TaxID=38942 RepID=UPI002161822C|nr:chaperone protein dnaJ 20, chloroplastic-like [Quercus robur]XP_050239028.1 chaperone protein dnaJ 20, chloroplastic-like [Quercus robur]XP_050239029.1 chaperone protein dnaJ 20, chloroplastic-like [Quercus robur]XP_050239030.1 chaperone protein dnaJ 20, chloroplastic-like [Quercus robur]XP_050239031.1 chaperone protein dnaJ 20, chloroplastic-like [Quercus robur]